jgi:hypothetical protein
LEPFQGLRRSNGEKTTTFDYGERLSDLGGNQPRRSRSAGVRLFDTEAKRKRAVARAVEKVAKHLGNTPTICRRCYIHPAIFDGYLDGTLLITLKDRVSRRN